MVKTIKLEALVRENEKLADVRQDGFIPAVLYGPEAENVNLKVKKKEIEKMFSHHNAGSLLDLSIGGGEPIRAIIKDEQRDRLKNNIIHLDFYRVNMKNKIEVEIPLHFINESKAVKELGGVLSKNVEILEVKCLPNDLVDKIDVDLSLLNTMDDSIKVSDLKLPESFELLNHGIQDVVAHVIELKVEEEPVVEQEPVEPEAGAAQEKPQEEKKSNK